MSSTGTGPGLDRKTEEGGWEERGGEGEGLDRGCSVVCPYSSTGHGVCFNRAGGIPTLHSGSSFARGLLHFHQSIVFWLN